MKENKTMESYQTFKKLVKILYMRITQEASGVIWHQNSIKSLLLIQKF